MTASRYQIQEQERPSTNIAWLLIALATIGGIMLGYSFRHDAGSVTTIAAPEQPPIMETLAAAQLLALTPIPTDIPTSTPTDVVWPTDTPVPQLDWCSQVAIQTPCSLPPVAATAMGSNLVSCELKTPSNYTQVCLKTDGMGTNGRDQTH